MQWVLLKTAEDLDRAIELSASTEVDAVLLFKHSTRCSISQMALSRLERQWDETVFRVPVFYLDLLNHRDISNAIAQRTNVTHQSPQVLLIRNGQCFYHASHSEISAGDIQIAVKAFTGTQN